MQGMSVNHVVCQLHRWEKLSAAKCLLTALNPLMKTRNTVGDQNICSRINYDNTYKLQSYPGIQLFTDDIRRNHLAPIHKTEMHG